MMDTNAVTLAVITMMMMVFTCDARTAQSIGSVKLINAVGEKVIVPLCTGPDGDKRGPGYVDFPDFQYFSFPVNVLSRGWQCTFEYVSTAKGNRKYTANVLVWEGILHPNDVPDLHASRSYVPCINCVWKIQRDGFYRADDNNHESFRLMARWD